MRKKNYAFKAANTMKPTEVANAAKKQKRMESTQRAICISSKKNKNYIATDEKQSEEKRKKETKLKGNQNKEKKSKKNQVIERKSKEKGKENISKEKQIQEKYRWITDSSSEQVVPDACPLAKKCGGCSYQGIAYETQLKQKYSQVNKLLKRFVRVSPIIGMDNPYHYRNKVHAVFTRAANGTVLSGIYQEGTHNVINVDACQIEDETADKIIVDIRGLLKSFKIKTYDEDTQYGLLRHVLIRRGFASGQVMVVLVLSSPILPSKNNFVKALRKLHPEITTILLNINDKQTNMVLGERNITLYGKGYIEDQLCGLTFRISPSSFYQVNPTQTERLYQTAIQFAGLTGNEHVIDAYCGIGTIGLAAAKSAKTVTGIECNRDAVRDAIINAKINGIKNIYFYHQDAGEFITEYAENKEKADVVFMDPPRSGCSESFLRAVVKLTPKKIVYISCNPETLARDLKYLTRCGYRGMACQPIDMFPFSGHVETVCLLSRK